MDPRQETLEELYRKVEGRFFDTAIDEDIKDWANEQLAIAQTEIDLVVRGREGYLDFLVAFISREHARFDAGSVERVPYDTLREAPLCTCRDRCKLSQGEVPGQIRNADRVGRGVLEFTHDHSGDPVVLDHEGDPPGARQVWAEKRRNALYVLRRVETYLSHHLDAPPKDGVLTAGEIDAVGQQAVGD